MPVHQRSTAIDAFRGLAVILMVLANFIAGVSWVPAALKHTPDVGFTLIDLVAPMFIFAIGLTYGSSARRRWQRDGGWAALQHFILRYFSILGIGAFFSAGEILLNVDGQTINWGVLQAIGLAGLVTLPFIRTPAAVRLGVGLALLAAYQILLDRFGWLPIVLASPHGGMFGALSWSALLILSTALADLTKQTAHRPWLPAAAAALCSLSGLLLSIWVPISKNRVSAPYILLTLGLSGLIYLAFRWAAGDGRVKFPLLTLYGRHSLVLYVLHLFLLGIVFLPGIPAFYSQAAPLLVLVEALTILTALAFAARWLDRRHPDAAK